MIQKIKNFLKKRKAKLFFLFLLFSGLAWFISNLSHRYTSNTSFVLDYTKFPDSLMLLNSSKEKVTLKLEAVGFQILLFNLGKKHLNIDLSEVKRNSNRYFLTPSECKRQIEQQLPTGVNLAETVGDTLYFNLYRVISKKVPVRSGAVLNFAQNYLLDGDLKLIPDSLTIKGPQSELDSIGYLTTAKLDLTDLSKDFSINAEVLKSPKLANTQFSLHSVKVVGKVVRFSEKIITVPVLVINLPEARKAQTFPDKVQVLVKAKLDELKQLKASDFSVIADYSSVEGSNINILPLKLGKKPDYIYAADLLTDQVEFILKRE